MEYVRKIFIAEIYALLGCDLSPAAVSGCVVSRSVPGRFAFITLRFSITSLFYGWAVVARANWLWKIVLLAALITAGAVLHAVGILEVSSRWVLGLLALLHIGELFLLMYMRKLLLHGQRPA